MELLGAYLAFQSLGAYSMLRQPTPAYRSPISMSRISMAFLIPEGSGKERESLKINKIKTITDSRLCGTTSVLSTAT